MAPFEHSADAPYDVVCDSADRAAWLAARLTGIGASEAPAVLGESRWSSPLKLYAEKTGAIVHDETDLNEAQYWGTRFERIVAEEFTRRTGVEHQWHGLLLRSKRYPWALATLDAVALGDPLECKTASAYKLDEWANGTPIDYVIQAHQQMLVFGSPRSRVACLVGGQRFIWDTVQRDEVLTRKLIARGDEFWQRVQNEDPPEVDGSEHSFEALEALYGGKKGLPSVMLSGDFVDLDGERQALKERIKAAGARVDAIDASIVAAMGGATLGLLPSGVSYAWPEVTRKGYEVKPTTYRTLRRVKAK